MADDNRKHQVSLGCGTLILIALIVMIFSNRNAPSLEQKVDGLSTQVTQLKGLVEAQTVEIKQLQQKLDRKQAEAVPGK